MITKAKAFTALAAAATLGLAAFATAQPAQAHHHHHHRHVGVIIAPAGSAYAYSGAYGCYWKRQLGLACASRTSLCLETTTKRIKNETAKTERPSRLSMQAPLFPSRAAKHNTSH